MQCKILHDSYQLIFQFLLPGKSPSDLNDSCYSTYNMQNISNPDLNIESWQRLNPCNNPVRCICGQTAVQKLGSAKIGAKLELGVLASTDVCLHLLLQ